MLRCVQLLIVTVGVAAAQLQPPPEQCNSTRLLPPNFADKAYAHVVFLAANGPRPPASAEERKALAYLRAQLQRMRLKTVVEEFALDSYETEDLTLRMDGTYRPVSVAFNPYAGVFHFDDVAEFVDPQELSTGTKLPDLEDRYVISAPPANIFQLMLRKPKLVIIVVPDDFARLKSRANRRFELLIQGHARQRRSANLIAEVRGRAGASRNIIVSAHLDSYPNSPGADDNASGMGVLLELARHFKSQEGRLNANIKIVAFGAEELGVAGSRAYVLRHAEELGKCALVVNLDQLGGTSGPFVQMLGGVVGLPERIGTSLFPPDLMKQAWQGLDSNWQLLDPRILRGVQVSNHPEWLRQVIEESANALAIEIIPSGNPGSDELSFTQAGVVATAVGYSSDVRHTPRDTPENVRKGNLEIVGKLVACIIGKVGAGH